MLGVAVAGVAVSAGARLPWTAGVAAQSPGTSRVPVFELDTAWPKLPNNWVPGQVPGVAVDPPRLHLGAAAPG
jgi:hypothetical protein